MKQIKLEVGKTYRSRTGEEVKITGCDGGYYQPYKGTNGEWYTEGGKWQSSPEESPKDLIEEVPEPRHTFAIPNGVKEVAVSQEGNRIVVEMVPDIKEPKPGDVMINKYRSVYILKSIVGKVTHKYFAHLGKSGRLAIDMSCYAGRPATSEEAQPLFDALKKAGKRWNPKTMQVEDIPEIDRIREWVERYVLEGCYSEEGIADVIEAYLKYKEGEK